jgi:hypothetical protein
MADALGVLAGATYDEAAARGEAIAALSDFGESLTNVPQDFNVELARMRAAAGVGNGTQLVGAQNTLGAGAGNTRGPSFVVQNLTVVANNPQDLMGALMKQSEKASFQQTGGTDRRGAQNIGAS